MSSAKISLSTPVPQEMKCQRCRRFNQEKWKSRSQTIRRGPITPSPQLPVATLSSGPHLMGHNIILRHVPALYTSSKHNCRQGTIKTDIFLYYSSRSISPDLSSPTKETNIYRNPLFSLAHLEQTHSCYYIELHSAGLTSPRHSLRL